MATKSKHQNEQPEPERDVYQVMIQLGKRQYHRLEAIAKPFEMTPEEAAQMILIKQLAKD